MTAFLASYGKWNTYLSTACLVVVCVPMILFLLWTGQQALKDKHTAMTNTGILSPYPGPKCSMPTLCQGLASYQVNQARYQAVVTYDSTKMQPGQVNVFYDPANPTDAVVQRNSATFDFGMAAGLAGMLAFAVWWARQVGKSKTLSTYAGLSNIL